MQPLTRRITAEYRTATPEQITAGREWYPTAHSIARDMADHYGLTIEQTSGVVSALSPITAWDDNIRRAWNALADYAEYGTVSRGHTAHSIANVNMILRGEDPDTVLRGNKTNAFYRAILSGGIDGVAVVDRHAWNMLLGTVGANAPTDKQYRTAADMFQRASDILGAPVHTVQAVTWCAWRDRNAWKTVKTMTKTA